MIEAMNNVFSKISFEFSNIFSMGIFFTRDFYIWDDFPCDAPDFALCSRPCNNQFPSPSSNPVVSPDEWNESERTIMQFWLFCLIESSLAIGLLISTTCLVFKLRKINTIANERTSYELTIPKKNDKNYSFLKSNSTSKLTKVKQNNSGAVFI